jgi:nucleotide-binding universal stress UspA family protein
MQALVNILVGVDLSYGETISSAVCQAVHSAVCLAAETSACVTFVPILAKSRTEGDANEILSSLAGHARGIGVRAAICPDRLATAADVIHFVRQNHHDLLLVGAPHDRGLVSALFGSEITRLIHRCPCPVWLAVPGVEPRPRGLMIASDLTPFSHNALLLGLRLARALNLRAHLLHVVDYPLDHHWTTGERDSLSRQYHQNVRQSAEDVLREQLMQVDGWQDLNVELHVIGRSGVPEIEIHQFIRDHQIDLAIMGDSSRRGLVAALFGNTTDWVLPELRCSLLVVKASDLPGGLDSAAPTSHGVCHGPTST